MLIDRMEDCQNFGQKIILIQVQRDQIGRFIGLWATFQSLLQRLICPNLLNS